MEFVWLRDAVVVRVDPQSQERKDAVTAIKLAVAVFLRCRRVVPTEPRIRSGCVTSPAW